MAGEIRLDLNGLRVKLPGSHPIYWIDKGKRRHIPSPEVYNRLFETCEDIIVDIDIVKIELGTQISSTAYLASPPWHAYYLIDGQEKRLISGQAVWDYYRFKAPTVLTSAAKLASLKDGGPIELPAFLHQPR